MTTRLREHLGGHDRVRTRAGELDLDTPISVFRLAGGEGLHRELHLQRVICAETEDLLDGDELRIDVFVDGAFERAGRRKMRSGDHAEFDWRVPFQDEAVIRLVDEDMIDETVPILPSVDHDDILGRATFTAPMRGQVEIAGDGARYGLNVEVVERAGVLPTAFDLLEDFRQSTAPGVWHRIDKTTKTYDNDTNWDATAEEWTTKKKRRTLVEQVEERLRRPWRVNQGPIGLCGPASVLFELIRTNPRRYVRMVRALFEHGTFTLSQGKVVNASGVLRGQSPWAEEKTRDDGTTYVDETPSADWIVLSALRESADLGSEDPSSESSTNWEAAEWMHDLLGYARVEFERTDATAAWFKLPDMGVFDDIGEWLSGGELGATDTVRQSIRTHAAGGSVLLTIHGDLLRAPLGSHAVTYRWIGNLSSHLITLVPRGAELVDVNDDPIPVHNDISQDGTVNLTVFTWGRVQQVTAPLDDVERELFLAITGRH